MISCVSSLISIDKKKNARRVHLNLSLSQNAQYIWTLVSDDKILKNTYLLYIFKIPIISLVPKKTIKRKGTVNVPVHLFKKVKKVCTVNKRYVSKKKCPFRSENGSTVKNQTQTHEMNLYP